MALVTGRTSPYKASVLGSSSGGILIYGCQLLPDSVLTSSAGRNLFKLEVTLLCCWFSFPGEGTALDHPDFGVTLNSL